MSVGCEVIFGNIHLRLVREGNGKFDFGFFQDTHNEDKFTSLRSLSDDFEYPQVKRLDISSLFSRHKHKKATQIEIKRKDKSFSLLICFIL